MSNNEYQEYLYKEFAEFWPEIKYQTYPPYHEGFYTERYFMEEFKKSTYQGDRFYIPVDWTTMYIQGDGFMAYKEGRILLDKLRDKLNTLDKSKKYFTVSQHDDAVKEVLPADTIRFSAGGNSGGTPIPLAFSRIKFDNNFENRDIFCYFDGSITHGVRRNMVAELSNKPDYVFKIKNWGDNTKLDQYISNTLRSIFTLAPRGYGKSSARMYEAMQLGSIPIYIYDDVKWLPYEDIIDWSEFAVVIKSSEIKGLDAILKCIDAETRVKMSNKAIEVYDNYFALENLTKMVLYYLEKSN